MLSARLSQTFKLITTLMKSPLDFGRRVAATRAGETQGRVGFTGRVVVPVLAAPHCRRYVVATLTLA